jgi:indolepyruvate ferredoxin oxidoreductase beta subunit
LSVRPFTILVAALGGEGGGMLSDWLVEAATHEGFPVQSTSIPGVSQRTGATTYYVEIFPLRTEQRPVMALIPSPGGIDLMAASELVEAGRAMQNAFVTADRTTLVASTHRIYATSEKMVPGDGRYDSDKILAAAPQLAQRALLFDMSRLAQEAGTVINAVLFGAMAGAGVLPLSRENCESAIRSGGKGAEASLRGFAAGYAQASGEPSPLPVGERAGEKGSDGSNTPLSTATSFARRAGRGGESDRVHREFPAQLHTTLDEAVARLTDYQDAAYAALYLDRVRQVMAVDREAEGESDGWKLTREAARLLALWMSYEDVIRVADLKTRRNRFARVRQEAGAKAEQPVVIVDYLKPGTEEIADIVPAGLAARLRNWEKSRGKPFNFGLLLKTSSIAGFLSLKLLSLLKPWRRKTSRFALEQATIERWLGAVKRLGFASLDRELAMEIVQCGRIVRGYGETNRRGRAALAKIFEDLLENEAAGSRGIDNLKLAVRGARNAALADPDCKPAGPATGAKAKPVIWMKTG